jgi:hypothetical protein
MNSTDKPWLRDPILAKTLRYWTAKRIGGRLPARADIDPLELDGTLLPHIVLTEAVIADGRRRFRFRLSGTAMSAAAGLELTGQFVDTLNPNKEYAAYIEGIYGLAMDTGRPVYSKSLAVAARESATRTTRRLTCPLASDGQTVDMFFSAQTFEEGGNGLVPSLTFADSFRAGPTIVLPAD